MRRTTNEGVIKHWINMSPDSISNHGSLFVKNGVLYSYGEHFPIGRFIRSLGACLFIRRSDWNYSATTQRHCQEAFWALANRRPLDATFLVANPLAETREEHVKNYYEYAYDLRNLGELWQRGRRKKQSYLFSIESLSNEATTYVHTFISLRYVVHPCLAALRSQTLLVESRTAKEFL